MQEQVVRQYKVTGVEFDIDRLAESRLYIRLRDFKAELILSSVRHGARLVRTRHVLHAAVFHRRRNQRAPDIDHAHFVEVAFGRLMDRFGLAGFLLPQHQLRFVVRQLGAH